MLKIMAMLIYETIFFFENAKYEFIFIQGWV